MGRGGGGGSVEAQLREPSISYLALFWMLWVWGGGGEHGSACGIGFIRFSASTNTTEK
jgi:hypothetical protein